MHFYKIQKLYASEEIQFSMLSLYQKAKIEKSGITVFLTSEKKWNFLFYVTYE